MIRLLLVGFLSAVSIVVGGVRLTHAETPQELRGIWADIEGGCEGNAMVVGRRFMAFFFDATWAVTALELNEIGGGWRVSTNLRNDVFGSYFSRPFRVEEDTLVISSARSADRNTVPVDDGPRTSVARCPELPGDFGLVHDEGLRFFDTDAAGADVTFIEKLFLAGDVRRDGRLSVPEISRLVRIFSYTNIFVRNKPELPTTIKHDEMLSLLTVATMEGVNVGRQLVDAFDIDESGDLSEEELSVQPLIVEQLIRNGLAYGGR